MDNFYNEHEGYKKLRDILAALGLDNDLLNVVGDGILHGIDICMKNMVKEDEI